MTIRWYEHPSIRNPQQADYGGMKKWYEGVGEAKKQARRSALQKWEEREIAKQYESRALSRILARNRTKNFLQSREVQEAQQMFEQEQRQAQWDAQAAAQQQISDVWNRLKDPVIGKQLEANAQVQLEKEYAKPTVDADGNEAPKWANMSPEMRTYLVRERVLQDELDAAVKSGDRAVAHAVQEQMQRLEQMALGIEVQRLADKGEVTKEQVEEAGWQTSETPASGLAKADRWFGQLMTGSTAQPAGGMIGIGGGVEGTPLSQQEKSTPKRDELMAFMKEGLPPKPEDATETEGSSLLVKALYWAFEPFRQAGMTLADGVREHEAIMGSPEDYKGLLQDRYRDFYENYDPEMSNSEFIKQEWLARWKAVLPGGSTREWYEKLPWYKQLISELPVWVALGYLGITATAGRAALAETAVQGGVKGAAATVARTALAPVAGYEWVVGKGIQYGIKVPLKGVAKLTNQAFDEALSGKMGFWLAQQGQRGENANKIVQWFLQKNKSWLHRKANEAMSKRMAEKMAAKDPSRAAQQAADDIMEEVVPRLQAAQEAVMGKSVVPKGPTSAVETVGAAKPVTATGLETQPAYGSKAWRDQQAASFKVPKNIEKAATEPDAQVDALVTKWQERKKNIGTLKKDVAALKETHDVSEVEEAISDYQDIQRSDYTDAEEYQSERDDAWDNIITTLEGVEALEAVEGLGTVAPKQAPSVEKQATEGKQPWEMTAAEFDAEFWFHGKSTGHPTAGQQKITGGATTDFQTARNYATAAGGGEVHLIRASNLPVGAKADIERQIQENVAAGGTETWRPTQVAGMGSVPAQSEAVVPASATDPRKYLIEKAISLGKHVPAEVLAEYPDLAASAPSVERGATEGIVSSKPATVPSEEQWALAEARDMVASELETAKKGIEKTTTPQQQKVGQQEIAKLEKELKDVDSLFEMQRRTDALNSERAKRLRSTIMAWANRKGLVTREGNPNQQFKDILKDYSEENPNPKRKSAIRLTQYTESELEGLLSVVREARPKKVMSKLVVTKKTEGKIQTLRSNLSKKGQMTDTDYARIMADLGLKVDAYVDGKHFITESEGKDLLKAMLDESEYIGRRVKQEAAVESKPEIAKVIKDIEQHGITKKQPKRTAVQALEDYRYLFQDLEKQSGVAFYDAWQYLNDSRLTSRYKFKGYFEELQATVKDFGDIADHPESQERIREWLSSHLKQGPKRPTLSAEELAVAQKMQQQLDSLKGLVRYLRVREAYQTYGNNPQVVRDQEIKDAPITDLRRAFDILERQGKEGLVEFLEDKDWGVIGSGYSPEEVIRPKVRAKSRKRDTELGKGHLMTRTGIHFGAHERTLFQQYGSYLRQVLRLEELDAPIRHMVRTFDEAQPKLDNPAWYADRVSEAITSAKGYQDSGIAGAWMKRLYGQVIQAVFLDPAKWIRNLPGQNLAFHLNSLEFVRLDNKHLSPQQELHFTIFVSQKMGMIHDYLMQGQQALPGLVRITKLAKRINMYPLTDEKNRLWSFYVSLNKARRAVESYRKHKDVNKLLSESGADTLEPLQERAALRLLAQDLVDYETPGLDVVSGEEAFERFVGREVTNNVHFMYDRAERSAFEQMDVGTLVGNLMAFPRGVAQRVVLQARKVKNGRTFHERWMGTRTIAHMMIVGFLIGEAYKKVTGREYNPYNLLNIWQWVPGGLSMGAAQEAGELFGDLLSAVQGDRDAVGRITTALPRVNSLFIPFYDITIESLEALTDKKNIDTYALRKIRDAIDAEYKVRDSAYEIKRDFIEAMQHALFGGEVPKEEQNKAAPKYPSRIT